MPSAPPVLPERTWWIERDHLLGGAYPGDLDPRVARRKLEIGYLDLQGVASRRVVRPLGCFHWDAVWTLAAWCELRDDFRNFRVDRLFDVQTRDDTFRDEPGRTLADLFRLEGC